MQISTVEHAHTLVFVLAFHPRTFMIVCSCDIDDLVISNVLFPISNVTVCNRIMFSFILAVEFEIVGVY